MNTHPITDLLKQYFKTKLSSDFNMIEQYASEMQMSPKKLQRLLKEENTTFSAELNAYRMQQTRELLEQTKLPFLRIAHMLGYSSSEALNIACKRWYGCSPRRLRKMTSAN